VSPETTTSVGRRGEDAALRHLESAGLRLLERNYRCRGGEIDLVMQEGSTLVLVEVRLRSSGDFGGAAAAVDWRKCARLRRAALALTGEEAGPVRMDVIAMELTADGRVCAISDQTEMGQGMRTVFAQIVADRLGIPFEDVDVVRQDTSVVPNSGPTVASRTTMVVGGLVARAADRLKAAVEERAPGPFSAVYEDVARTHGALRFDEQFTGYPDITWDDATYVGDAYPAFSWAAATAEVEVDLDTGEVAVKHVVSADDCGTVINPLMAAGQVEGGSLQAVGYATIEEMKLKDGRFLNDRLSKYLIPTSLDAPKITAVLVENPFANEPHGAKGIGELPMDVVAPAVVAAIHDATGVWINELPATPERILAALDAADRDGEEARS